MTEQEMLFYAAIAAGYNKFDGHAQQMIDGGWNPLESSDDALSLAVDALNWPFGGNAFDNAVCCMNAVKKLPKNR